MFESRREYHPSYVPSRFELEHMARVWWHEFIDVSFYCYVCQQCGSTELRLLGIAAEQLTMLQKELGEDAFNRIELECENRYGQQVKDPVTWQRFLAGQPLE